MKVSICVANKVVEDIGHILTEAGFKYAGGGTNEVIMTKDASLAKNNKAKLVKRLGEAYFVFFDEDDD